MAIEIFNRVEAKYILTQSQVNSLLPLIHANMESDIYNKDNKTYPISNLYFDTSSDELIIKSLEKPIYKEKLRLRSYGQAKLSDIVYLEIKKKFDGIVYKRRTPFILEQAYEFIYNKKKPDYEQTNWQVLSEIQNLMERYTLFPKVFISYDRFAFFENNNSDFRLTLDTNILSRREDLKLESNIYGEPLLEKDVWLLEAKAFKAFPLWFVQFLSKNKIFQASFSKYGSEARKNIIL